MHILILGAAGMLGRKLAQAIAAGGLPCAALTLADQVPPVPPAPATGQCVITCLTTDLAQPAVLASLVAGRPDVIFHLAAIVSAEAEADLDRGYAINLDATRSLLQAVSALPDYCPKVIFASSIAVFGTPLPDIIPDHHHLTPRSSYGTQKAMAELLLADYTRRGFVQGIALRLPTICIRPGAPNRAASGFFSGILREPLAGQPARLPVRDSLRHWFASPRAATGFFVRAARLDHAALQGQIALNMPGLSATVADQIAALARFAGTKATGLIHHAPDPAIAAIVETWPQAFSATQALDLGFVADSSFDAIIAAYVADDMPQG
ncbi:MAG: SDR family oxidoreductase [Rhodobacteraceae bacterium]|jgi:D-erythronate 2-dehydrogenase|nr:SDR family oxidoreductase [Paracoccaceae bacterium]